jgi:hypothetical protein
MPNTHETTDGQLNKGYEPNKKEEPTPAPTPTDGQARRQRDKTLQGPDHETRAPTHTLLHLFPACTPPPHPLTSKYPSTLTRTHLDIPRLHLRERLLLSHIG